MIRNESILDEKYIEIQNTATKHLTTLQNVVTVLKNKRKDVSLTVFFFYSNIYESIKRFRSHQLVRRQDRLGELSLISSTSSAEQPVSLSMTIDDNNNRTQLIASSGVRQVGQWGNGPLEFWCPSGLAITRNNEHLIVVDSWNHRLQVRKPKTDKNNTVFCIP